MIIRVTADKDQVWLNVPEGEVKIVQALEKGNYDASTIAITDTIVPLIIVDRIEQKRWIVQHYFKPEKRWVKAFPQGSSPSYEDAFEWMRERMDNPLNRSAKIMYRVVEQ